MSVHLKFPVSLPVQSDPAHLSSAFIFSLFFSLAPTLASFTLWRPICLIQRALIPGLWNGILPSLFVSWKPTWTTRKQPRRLSSCYCLLVYLTAFTIGLNSDLMGWQSLCASIVLPICILEGARERRTGAPASTKGSGLSEDRLGFCQRVWTLHQTFLFPSCQNPIPLYAHHSKQLTPSPLTGTFLPSEKTKWVYSMNY